jgi:hypothetical protein
MATLLGICTRALDEIGSFNVPDFFIGADDDTAKQIVAIAKKVGTELVRDYDWQETIRTGSVTTSNGDSSYALESDYERMVSDTTWNTTSDRRMWGNATSRDWAMITTLPISAGSAYYFRIARGEIQVSPTPSSAFSFTYEYRSKNYCETSSGTDLSEWTNDTDLPLLPEDLFIAGIKFYFLKANNLPYGDAEADYDGLIRSRQGKNTPGGIIDMNAGVCAPTHRPTYGVGLNFPALITDS